MEYGLFGEKEMGYRIVFWGGGVGDQWDTGYLGYNSWMLRRDIAGHSCSQRPRYFLVSTKNRDLWEGPIFRACTIVMSVM